MNFVGCIVIPSTTLAVSLISSIVLFLELSSLPLSISSSIKWKAFKNSG